MLSLIVIQSNYSWDSIELYTNNGGFRTLRYLCTSGLGDYIRFGSRSRNPFLKARAFIMRWNLKEYGSPRWIRILRFFCIGTKPVLNDHPSRILILGDGMGYHISYRSIHKKHVKKGCSLRLPLLILVCFLLFLFLVQTQWPDGAEVLRNVFSFHGDAVAVSALNDFAEELRQGEPLLAAFSQFCRKLIS